MLWCSLFVGKEKKTVVVMRSDENTNKPGLFKEELYHLNVLAAISWAVRGVISNGT